MPVHHSARPVSRHARPLPARAVLCTTIACVLATAFSAQAQDSAPPAQPPATGTTTAQAPVTLDNITVIGQRASLNQAVQAKQMSDHVMEVISADNMGQMPNVTVAGRWCACPASTAPATAATRAWPPCVAWARA